MTDIDPATGFPMPEKVNTDTAAPTAGVADIAQPGETPDPMSSRAPPEHPGPTNVETLPGIMPEKHARAPKKIAILGTCPSRVDAPVDDISWEIWTIGPGGKNANRWERLFEVHGAASWPPGFREYLSELAAVKPPRVIYTEAPMPDWPANVVINKEALFHKYGRMWFQSQISYALAMALEEGVTELGVFGIDLEAGEEYRSQFTGAKYFLQLARLAGVNIHMPTGCGLLRDPAAYPDAWETHFAMTIQSKLNFLHGIVNVKRQELELLTRQIHGAEGEIAAFDFMRSLYVISAVDPNTPKALTEETISEKVERIDLMLRQFAELKGVAPR